jgi:hypothetical protein
MEFDSEYEEQAAKQQAELKNWLTVPRLTDGPMRSILEEHVNNVLREHNARVHAKLTYLKTGEVTNRNIDDWCSFVNWNDKSQAVRLALFLSKQLISPEETAQMSDRALLAYYGKTLLQLRAIYLPDPMP